MVYIYSVWEGEKRKGEKGEKEKKEKKVKGKKDKKTKEVAGVLQRRRMVYLFSVGGDHCSTTHS